MGRAKSDYMIQSVANALRILEEFQDVDLLGVTELSRKLDLHKNSVFRLLATLEQKGYVEQCPRSELYRLGSSCLELGRAFLGPENLTVLVRPVLEALAIEFQETIHLAVLNDFEVVHLDGEQPGRMLMSGLRTGQRLPAYCTASGKLLLGMAADSPSREAFGVWLQQPEHLLKRAPNTLVDSDKLLEQVYAAGTQGYALDLEECEEGLHCLSVPVMDAAGLPIAAISVSGPSFRLSEEHMLEDLLPVLQQQAETLSQQLGFHPRSAA